MGSSRRLAYLLAQTLALHASLLRAVSAQSSDVSYRIEIGATAGMAIISVAGARMTLACDQTEDWVHRSALSARAGFRLTRRLVVEGTLESVGGGPDNTVSCGFGTPPPRAVGPDTITKDLPSAFPKTTVATLRAELVPWSRSWAEGRLYVGVGRLWYLHRYSAVGGAQGRLRIGGIDRLYLVAEAEAARYSAPVTHSVRYFQDGLPAGGQQTPAPGRSRVDATFRIGLAGTL